MAERYKKSNPQTNISQNPLKVLRELALAESMRKHPDLPASARYIKSYSDRTANALSRAILDFCRLNGHLAERTGCTGRYVDNTKVITDCLGFKKRIGSGKWIPTSGTKGTSDLKLVINSIAIACEIKMPGDRMRPDQEKYKKAYEKAGGRYIIVSSYEDFLNQINTIINH